MKKLIFTFVLTFFVCAIGFAQVGFGIKAGANLSKFKSIDPDDTETSDSRLSFNGGVFIVAELSDKLALQPELVLSMEGGKEETSLLGVDFKAVAKYTFVNIPVLLRYSIVEKFNLYAGPQIGLNVGAKTEVTIDDESEEEDIDDVSTLGLGLGLGLGYYVTEKLEINARYNLGLSNWYNGEGSDDFKSKINTIQIGLAYRLK